MKSNIDKTLDKLNQIPKLERLTSSNKKPLKVYQGESIWPYIQMGILESKYINLKENLIPEKITKFSQVSEYSFFDPEEGEYIERFNIGYEPVNTLKTLEEKGYVKLEGFNKRTKLKSKKLLKEFNRILDNAIFNMKDDTSLITQTHETGMIKILKPFAIQRNYVPKFVLDPAAKFRKIIRNNPEDYNKLLTFIRKL